MLEIRPTCENCNRPLPPNAPDAMICTIECTFCRDCVDTVLSNVCQNCGGGFERRPVRPAHAWVEGAPQFPPPSTTVVHKPVDPATHAALVASIGGRSPSQRGHGAQCPAPTWTSATIVTAMRAGQHLQQAEVGEGHTDVGLSTACPGDGSGTAASSAR